MPSFRLSEIELSTLPTPSVNGTERPAGNSQPIAPVFPGCHLQGVGRWPTGTALYLHWGVICPGIEPGRLMRSATGRPSPCAAYLWRYRPSYRRTDPQITPRCGLVAQALGVARRPTEIYTAHQCGSRPRPMRQSLSRPTLCCCWFLKSGGFRRVSRIAAMCEQYENGLISSIRKCIDFSPDEKKPAQWRAMDDSGRS